MLTQDDVIYNRNLSQFQYFLCILLCFMQTGSSDVFLIFMQMQGPPDTRQPLHLHIISVHSVFCKKLLLIIKHISGLIVQRGF